MEMAATHRMEPPAAPPNREIREGDRPLPASWCQVGNFQYRVVTNGELFAVHGRKRFPWPFRWLWFGWLPVYSVRGSGGYRPVFFPSEAAARQEMYRIADGDAALRRWVPVDEVRR